MSEETDQRDAARGERAQMLLANPLLAEAFTALEAEYVEHWKASPARDTDGRERLFQAIHVLSRVKTHLEMMVSNGAIARRALEELRRRTKAD